jgi:hypothetical protein
VQDAVNGAVTINPDGKIAFTGNPLYHGDAYFTYTVADAFGRQSTARVKVMLGSTNHDPVAIDHNSSITATENTVLKIPFSVLLQGATDPDGDALTLVSAAALVDDQGNLISPTFGVGYLQGTNVLERLMHDDVLGDYIEIKPSKDYYGFAGFRYEVSDGQGGTAWANFQFYIDHANQAPRVGESNSESFRIRLGQTTVLRLSDLMGGAWDPDGDAVHFVGIHDIAGATVSYDAAAGTISITPRTLGIGTGSFQFDIADIYNATSAISVSLNVIPQYDPCGGGR